MQEEKILCSLIGLVGAINNNGKTDNTDNIVLDALSYCYKKEKMTKERTEYYHELIEKEKNCISPDCAICENPCGSTSFYNIERYETAPNDIKSLKKAILDELEKMAFNIKDCTERELPNIVYKALAYWGYDLSENSYRNLLNEIIIQNR